MTYDGTAGRRTPALVAVLLALALAISALLLTPATRSSAVAPDPNPWLQQRFLNMAHQGGEDEAPSNTMFAFKSAMRDRGADSLELDVNLTSDGELVVIHDDTVSRTTNGPQSRPASEVNDLTLAQIRALDAGYWFRPGSYSHSAPAEEYVYRGVRTGEEPPPAGYSAGDFRIPTLREVLDTFPTTPINIEIKMVKTETGDDEGDCTPGPGSYCDDVEASIPVAAALAALLDEPEYAARDDLIVVSFSDVLINTFHAADDPPQVALAPGVAGTALFVAANQQPSPDVAAFQVPPDQGGFALPERLLGPPPNGLDAHGQGYAVHIWTNGDQDETDAAYKRFLDAGVDGVMTSVPSRLHAFLCANEVPRPDGSDRCPNPAPAAKKKCKKGKKLHKGKCVKKGKKKKKGKKRK